MCLVWVCDLSRNAYKYIAIASSIKHHNASFVLLMISLKDLYHIVAAPELLAAPSIYQKDKPKVGSKYIGFDSYNIPKICHILWIWKPKDAFFHFSFCATFFFLLINALGYDDHDIDQGIH